MAAPSPPESPRRLGDFEIVRELGRGGMGVVYEAVQVSLNRKVALKVLASSLGLTANSIERFQREAEAAAKLHHTNIVPVYATGAQDGIHFYAMEMIEGTSLDRVIRGLRQGRTSTIVEPARTVGPTVAAGSEEPAKSIEPTAGADLAATGPYVEKAPSPSSTSDNSSGLSSGSGYFDTVARIIADVADALDHAHKNGVIHRDIKPANLLLASTGRLSVNDFGLARILEQPGMTMTGEFVGTPAYMSPEQIASGRIPLDHRTDIYSLGATLYELLTLERPFHGERRDQMLAQIVQNDPRAPRRLNPQIPMDLETICLKAMEKDPDRRYRSAKDLAEDLRRFVNRYAIAARRAGPLERLHKWVRRHPGLAAALGAVLLAVGSAGYFAYQSHVAGRQIQQDKLQKALDDALVKAMGGDFPNAEKALDEAVLLGATIGQIRLLRGQFALHRGQTKEALDHLEEAARLLPNNVAAQAILFLAYLDAGQYDRFYIRINELERLKPTTAEDFLYRGQVLCHSDIKEGLPMIDKAIELRDSYIARLIRADVRTKIAQQTGRPEDTELAIEDAGVARALLPKNPVALAISLEAHLVAANTYERLGQAEKSAAAQEQAARDAETLKRFPTFPRGVRSRLLYLDRIGDEEGIRAEYLRVKEGQGVPSAARFYFHVLYRRGEFAEALKVLEHYPKTGNEMMVHIMRAFTLANLPDGPAKALAEYREAVESGKGGRRGARGDLYPPTVLCFLGRSQEAADFYRMISKAGVDLPREKGRWYQKVVDFQAGLASADDLLATAGSSQWYLCEGHFFIGINLLGRGDRQGAREHFEKSIDTRVVWFLEHEWSRSLLARMQNDRAWPPWIPNQEEPKKCESGRAHGRRCRAIRRH